MQQFGIARVLARPCTRKQRRGLATGGIGIPAMAPPALNRCCACHRRPVMQISLLIYMPRHVRLHMPRIFTFFTFIILQECAVGDSAPYPRQVSASDDVVIVAALRTPLTKVSRAPVAINRTNVPPSTPLCCLTSFARILRDSLAVSGFLLHGPSCLRLCEISLQIRHLLLPAIQMLTHHRA